MTLTPEQRKAIVDRYTRGQGMAFIAFALGSSAQTVKAVLLKEGVKIRKVGQRRIGRSWVWTGRL